MNSVTNDTAGAAPAAVAPQGEYPHLPQSVGDVTDFGDGKVDIDWGHPAPVGGTRLYSADQMRAYVDADRVARAGQPAAVTGPALALVERQALEALCAVAVAAFHAADDSSDNGNIIEVQRADFEALDAALDLLDELPDDQPGYTMTPGAKAKWALRRLLDAAPALEAHAAPAPADEFRGDTPSLVRNILALLELDAEGALVPHGVGGHARGLLSAAAARLAAAPQAPAAPVGQCVSKQCADAYIRLADAMGYDSGKDGIEWSPEEWAAHLLAAYRAAPAAPADPMDWPLPCDVTVGHGTIRKGCKLRTLVLRMQVLYDLSQKVELAAPASESPAQAPHNLTVSEAVAEFREVCEAARSARAAKAAPAAPAVDASDTALLDAMERERIAVIPEFEGPWDAQIFGEDEATLACGSGTTPRKAIAEALASLEARKAHDAAQAAAKGAAS